MLLAIFVYVSFHEIRMSPAGVTPFRGLLPVSEGTSDLDTPAPRPLRVLLATDGSPCSDRAVQSVAMRPWPSDSRIEVVSVVHTRMPNVVDAPVLMLAAAHEDALDAERLRAPLRVQRAQKCLAGKPGVGVTTRVLEGNPEDAIVDEADRWQADVIVLGSHGYGPVKRRLLGSVSQAVALHASCSVEIVRCPRGAA
ncbi:MAG: universal stress protein [Vicinamibacterales bacterium]